MSETAAPQRPQGVKAIAILLVIAGALAVPSPVRIQAGGIWANPWLVVFQLVSSVLSVSGMFGLLAMKRWGYIVSFAAVGLLFLSNFILMRIYPNPVLFGLRLIYHGYLILALRLPHIRKAFSAKALNMPNE